MVSTDLGDLGMREKVVVEIIITFLAIVHWKRNKFVWEFIPQILEALKAFH